MFVEFHRITMIKLHRFPNFNVLVVSGFFVVYSLSTLAFNTVDHRALLYLCLFTPAAFNAA